WIRAYNADPKHTHKLNFYGFDLPGSPGNPLANRGVRTAIEEVFSYLAKVDIAEATRFHRQLDNLIPSIHFDPRSADGNQYPKLGQSDRDVITAAIAEMISLLERREKLYIQASSSNDYQWAYRNSLAARSVDLWLRRIPVGWKPSSDVDYTMMSEA